MNEKETIVETIMSVDRANQIVVESMMELDFTDKEKLGLAKVKIEEAYTLILNSLA